MATRRGAASAPTISPEGTQGKKQISITIAPRLLAQIDLVAKKLGLSRASAISLGVARLVEEELGERK